MCEVKKALDSLKACSSLPLRWGENYEIAPTRATTFSGEKWSKATTARAHFVSTLKVTKRVKKETDKRSPGLDWLAVHHCTQDYLLCFLNFSSGARQWKWATWVWAYIVLNYSSNRTQKGSSKLLNKTCTDGSQMNLMSAQFFFFFESVGEGKCQIDSQTTKEYELKFTCDIATFWMHLETN